VVEAEAAAASEYEITGLPLHFDIVSFKATLTGGTGTTIGPVQFGTVTGFTANTQNHVATSTIAAAVHVNDQSPLGVSLATASMFVTSLVDAAADNDITSEYVIEYGG